MNLYDRALQAAERGRRQATGRRQEVGCLSVICSVNCQVLEMCVDSHGWSKIVLPDVIF